MTRVIQARNNRMADFSNTVLHWKSADGSTNVDFELGNVLGSGFFGRVYDVAHGPDPALVHGYQGPIVAKFGHYSNVEAATKDPVFFSKNALNGELKDYNEIIEHQAAIHAQADYPKDPAWGNHVPVIPILGSVQTDHGLILFKPKISGRSVESFHSMDELTPEMRKGLKDILSYGRAVNKAIPGGFASDFRPPNLVWLDDPEALRSLGYKRPGWALFEQTHAPFNNKSYVNLSDENYLKEFAGYVKPVPQKAIPQISFKQVLPSMMRSKGHVVSFLETMHDKAGPIFSMRAPALPKNMFFVADPVIINKVLMDTDRSATSAFAKSPEQIDALGKFFGDKNLFSSKFDEWRPQRKQLAPVFTAKEVSRPNYSGKMDEIIAGKMSEIQNALIHSHGGEDIDFKEFIHDTTLDILLRLLFDHELPPAELSELSRSMQHVPEAALVEFLNPFAKPVHEFPAITSYQKNVREWVGLTNKAIDQVLHRFESDPSSGSGFMNLLMSMRSPADGPITRNEIRNQIFGFLFAGHETVAHTLTWAFHDIFANPEVQQRLVQLVRSGNENAANEYIDQIWSEALRLHMPIPLIPRQAQRDIVLTDATANSIHIPQGATLVLDTSVMQRSEDFWGVAKTGYPADQFHPERFSPENQKTFGMTGNDNFKTYAFGAGPRFCIGASMANLEARKIIFQFFKTFDVNTAASGQKVKAARFSDALLTPNNVRIEVHGN